MKQLILVFLLISLCLAVPCGRCVLKGDICQFDSCSEGLVCRKSLGGSVSVCLDSVDRGKFCNNTKDYDPCITDFYCNRTSGYCELDPSKRHTYSNKNDGCVDDYYCPLTMSCKGGVCKPTDLAEGQCASTQDCNWNQYCDILTTTCRNLPGAGEKCYLGQCKYGTTCKSNPQVVEGVCTTYYSAGEGSGCTIGGSDCKAGLYCNYNGVCAKPKYSFFLGPQGISWGGYCYPGESGCRCHSGLKSFFYLRENQKTISQDCIDKRTKFDSCMSSAKCHSTNTAADSCMRKNCWNQYLDTINFCSDPTLVAQRCGAASLMIGFLLIVLVLVL